MQVMQVMPHPELGKTVFVALFFAAADLAVAIWLVLVYILSNA